MEEMLFLIKVIANHIQGARIFVCNEIFQGQIVNMVEECGFVVYPLEVS
jgi:hypothetical protein